MYKKLFLKLSFAFLCAGLLHSAVAQDLEPRRWTPLPLGTNVVGVGYVYTDGDLDFDPVLEIEDVTADIDTVLISHVNSFSLAGKLARFDVLLPWQKARWEGLVSGVPAVAKREGFADPRFRVSVNLWGLPDAGEGDLRKYLASRPVNTVVGAALSVAVPWGEYHSDKLLNLGSNRYTIRPQIGMVHTRGPWSYELTGSAFIFTDNDNFFGGKKREQDPIYAVQTHLVRSFKPGLWASLSAGYWEGGSSKIDGVDKDDERAAFLWAMSVGLPISRSQGFKIAYISSRNRKRIGSDSDSIAVAWSVLY